jgi:mannosyltransferase OCH1-like enzyme
VLALRQAGLFAEPRPLQPGHATIPRRIVQFWDQPEPPPDVLALMATWRENNPAWTYERFHFESADAFLAEHFNGEVRQAFRRARHPAHKADLFRLAWLHVNGGLHVDADDRCLAPLETMLPPGMGFLGYQEGFSTVSNNVLGAAPGHPVIARAMRGAVTALNRGDSDSLWLSTGPGLITRAFAAELADSTLKPASWLRGVCIRERFELLRSVAVHCFARYKTTRSHWKRSEFAAPG